MKEVDGIFGESRDEFGQQRFVPYKINEFFSGKTKNIDFLQFNKADFQLVSCELLHSRHTSTYSVFVSLINRDIIAVPARLLHSTTFQDTTCKFTNTYYTNYKY